MFFIFLLISLSPSNYVFADSFVAEATQVNEYFLGRIKNKKTKNSIEIFCIEGTLDRCTKIAFYQNHGIRDYQPIKTISLLSDLEIETRTHYQSTSAWVFNNDSGGAAFFPPFMPAAAATVVLDGITYPFRSLFSTKANALKNALNEALSTGSTVEVTNRHYKLFIEILKTSHN